MRRSQERACTPDGDQYLLDERAIRGLDGTDGYASWHPCQGSHMFCRVRGHVSTAKKPSVPALEAIEAVLDGSRFSLE
jgi:hypothetical protein